MSGKENTLVKRKVVSDLLYGDENYIREFAVATEESFKEFSVNYRKYLLKRDETNFRKAGHKIKPAAQMLHLDPIVDEYEHAKQLLWDEESTQQQLEKSVERIEQLCEQIIDDLREMQ